MGICHRACCPGYEPATDDGVPPGRAGPAVALSVDESRKRSRSGIARRPAERRSLAQSDRPLQVCDVPTQVLLLVLLGWQEVLHQVGQAVGQRVQLGVNA